MTLDVNGWLSLFNGEWRAEGPRSKEIKWKCKAQVATRTKNWVQCRGEACLSVGSACLSRRFAYSRPGIKSKQ